MTSYDDFFKDVCINLGIDYESVELNFLNRIEGTRFRGLSSLNGNDFEKTLFLLEVIWICLKNINHSINNFNLSETIEKCINFSKNIDGIDLGIVFNNGFFYKSGNLSLDNGIIDESLEKSAGCGFQNMWEDALKDFLSGKVEDSLSKCFTSLEGLFQEVLGSKFASVSKSKRLSEGLNLNKELSVYWDGVKVKDENGKQFIEWGIVQNLYHYLNEFSNRHSSLEPLVVDEVEAHGIIYFTGVVINTLIKSNLNSEPSLE